MNRYRLKKLVPTINTFEEVITEELSVTTQVLMLRWKK